MRHIIKLSMVLLAIVSTYFVYDTMQMVAPVWVAIASSVSLASVYVGLAFAEVPRHQRGNALVIAGSALAIESMFGILHTLRVMAPHLFTDMPVWAIVVLAVLFGVPFSALLFAVAHFVVHQEADEQDAPLLRYLATIAESSNRTMPAMLEHVAELAAASNRTMPAMLEQLAELAEASKSGLQASTKAQTAYACPNCGAPLTQGQYGSAVRHGHCSSCKSTTNGNGHDLRDTEVLM